ncbi:hypothetical protein [Symbiobacterium thermophilum]|uniref:hypothetical protein n=1 Tax=Symbiobacterium thermophilum TaxID=2734 RepID=UPI0013909F65|nr:hypothetical protein [Symbiobacterium thermophilum]
MILTESAAQKILELTGGADGRGLRIRLLPGGCCGTYYHFVIDDLGRGTWWSRPPARGCCWSRRSTRS